jgi:hypothetical protein
MVCPGTAGHNPDAAYHVADQGIRASRPQISRTVLPSLHRCAGPLVGLPGGMAVPPRLLAVRAGGVEGVGSGHPVVRSGEPRRPPAFGGLAGPMSQSHFRKVDTAHLLCAGRLLPIGMFWTWLTR